MNKQASTINPWYALRNSGIIKYACYTLILLSISLLLAISTRKWSWLSSAGGVIVLFGVLLSLRRLFRLGPQAPDNPVEPFVINGNQFNIKAMHQDIQRLIDNYAQKTGVAFMIAGTLLGAYGEVLLTWLFPFN